MRSLQGAGGFGDDVSVHMCCQLSGYYPDGCWMGEQCVLYLSAPEWDVSVIQTFKNNSHKDFICESWKDSGTSVGKADANGKRLFVYDGTCNCYVTTATSCPAPPAPNTHCLILHLVSGLIRSLRVWSLQWRLMENPTFPTKNTKVSMKLASNLPKIHRTILYEWLIFQCRVFSLIGVVLTSWLSVSVLDQSENNHQYTTCSFPSVSVSPVTVEICWNRWLILMLVMISSSSGNRCANTKTLADDTLKGWNSWSRH